MMRLGERRSLTPCRLAPMPSWRDTKVKGRDRSAMLQMGVSRETSGKRKKLMLNKFVLFLIPSLVLPATALAATPPAKGVYTITGYIVSATPKSACAASGLAAGQPVPGVFVYPGPAANGAIVREPSAQFSEVGKSVFPKTPAVGVTSWSGTLLASSEPSASNLKLPFTASLTYLDASSFSMKLNLKIPLSATTSCSTVQNFVMIRSDG
jgi:hypothetical protein